MYSMILFGLLGILAHADDSKFSRFPEKIECTGDIDSIKSVQIDKLNTPKPETNLDASLQNYLVGYVVQLIVSNECDNAYSFVFFADDLQDLKKRKVITVKGLVKYFNSNFAEKYPDDADRNATVEVSCHLN